MELHFVQENQWSQIKEIYLEAFPKRERKPFWILRRSVQRKKAQIFTATENGTLLGFTVVIPYQDMVMVDYLAVSGKIRSKGTGSQILQAICHHFLGKKIVLLIERLDEHAENYQQRIARRRFYFKNQFTSTNIYTTGAGGNMEILSYGGTISKESYLELQKYALGKLFFFFSNIKIVQ